MALFALGALLCATGCGTTGTPQGAVVGRADHYDYSPSVIQTGSLRQIWWCGEGPSNTDPTKGTDTILYESMDLITGQHIGPLTVLSETEHAWDSAYTCNPQVVRGTFTNPLGDGVTYTYAMYYEATAEISGFNNSIGVAFSSDGTRWKKYPSPVIESTYQQVYGPAQPAVFNSDGKQAVWLFYEDDEPPYAPDTHVQAISADGVHFTTLGTLTTEGLRIPPTLASWGNLAYSPADASWYATFNLPTRSRDTTENTEERGSYGFQIYRIPQGDLLTGKTGWQLLKDVDTNLTGYETVFSAGFARDSYGNLFHNAQGAVEVFPAFANVYMPWDIAPAAAAKLADVTTWDIGHYTWSSNDAATYVLTRYHNAKVHQVTTGWVDPQGGFLAEKTLGRLYRSPQQGADKALYSCKAGQLDAFLSSDEDCEGARRMGTSGYLYAQPVSGLSLLPLYRCRTLQDPVQNHSASTDPACEGNTPDGLLGYMLPQ